MIKNYFPSESHGISEGDKGKKLLLNLFWIPRDSFFSVETVVLKIEAIL